MSRFSILGATHGDGSRPRSVGARAMGTIVSPRGVQAFVLALAWATAAWSRSPDDGVATSAPTTVETSDIDPSEEGPGQSLESFFRDVMAASLVGPLRPDRWRPLGLDTFFSEGWNEAYAPVPDMGESGAPRQTWIDSADGAFYRLFVISFGYARGLPGNTDAYNGSYFMFTPISRRFEIGWFLPFVESSPNLTARNPRRYATGVGDLTIAPRFLLAEDKHYTITTNLYARLPIGGVANGNGAATLSPDLEFWANPFGRWVFRGAAGVTVPTNETRAKSAFLDLAPWSGFNASPSSFSSFDGRFAVGRHLTPADARLFPNLVISLAANLHSQISGVGHADYFTLAPGFRFGIGNDWYFLGGLEVPLVGPVPFQTQTIFQLIKNF